MHSRAARVFTLAVPRSTLQRAARVVRRECCGPKNQKHPVKVWICAYPSVRPYHHHHHHPTACFVTIALSSIPNRLRKSPLNSHIRACTISTATHRTCSHYLAVPGSVLVSVSFSTSAWSPFYNKYPDPLSVCPHSPVALCYLNSLGICVSRRRRVLPATQSRPPPSFCPP